MSITGPTADVLTFKSKHLIEFKLANPHNESGNELVFDFNTVIPMPHAIRDSESSSTVSTGLALLGRDDLNAEKMFGFDKSLDAMLSWPWVVEEGITDAVELGRHLHELHPDAVDKAREAIRAYEKYGHLDWYSWSIAEWGTKWNAYSLSEPVLNVIDPAGVADLAFKFDTAWSPPIPVLDKLAGMHPTLTIRVRAFDEGWNFAYVGQGDGGVWQGEYVDATDELYELVYGEKPEKHDDEQNEDAVVEDDDGAAEAVAAEPIDEK
jgi:hypothetical protein